jgi:hypothetical protein
MNRVSPRNKLRDSAHCWMKEGAQVTPNATVRGVRAKVVWIKKPSPRYRELDRGVECDSRKLTPEVVKAEF